MKYLVRLNKRAFNPLTREVDAKRVWEIEQCATPDSAKVIWHCEDIRIDKTPIRELFQLPTDGTSWEIKVFGICVRGQDNVVEIHTGPQDASGN